MGEEIPIEEPPVEYGRDCGYCLPGTTPRYISVSIPSASCDCYAYEYAGHCYSRKLEPSGNSMVVCEQDASKPCKWVGNFLTGSGILHEYREAWPPIPPCVPKCEIEYYQEDYGIAAIVEKIGSEWADIYAGTGHCGYEGGDAVSPGICIAGIYSVLLGREAGGCVCDPGLISIGEM
jgi:hypothetical protein